MCFFFFCSCWFSHLNNFCFNRTDTESARVYAECVPPNGRLCDVSAPFKAHQSRSRRSTQRCARGERGAEYNDRSLPNYNTGFQPRLLPERRKVVRTNSTGFVGAAMIEVNLLQNLTCFDYIWISLENFPRYITLTSADTGSSNNQTRFLKDF